MSNFIVVFSDLPLYVLDTEVRRGGLSREFLNYNFVVGSDAGKDVVLLGTVAAASLHAENGCVLVWANPGNCKSYLKPGGVS